MPEPIQPFSFATAPPTLFPPHWNNKIKPILLPPPPLFSFDPKTHVPAPNELGKKMEMYSLLLHHRYASNSKVSSNHSRWHPFKSGSSI